MNPPSPKKGLNTVTLRGNSGVRLKHDESKHTFYTMMKRKTRHTERQFFSLLENAVFSSLPSSACLRSFTSGSALK